MRFSNPNRETRLSFVRVLHVLLAACAFLPVGAFSAEYIRVASFNIAELGEGSHSATRHWPVVAGMLTENKLDLIAI